MRFRKYSAPTAAVWSAFVLIGLSSFFAAPLLAQGYPTKAVRVIVPFSAGGWTGSRRGGWFWGGDGLLPPALWHGLLMGFCVAVITLSSLFAGLLLAQSYPTKPVRVIVPFSAGGATDIVARVVSQKLYDVWGQTVLVDDRAGASGNIGGEIAAKSNPDGYTLFMTSGSIVTANQHLFRKMPFNPEKDLMPVTNVASGPQILAVNPGFAAKSVKDFIAMAKAKPKSITLGSAGFGTQTHLAAENFAYAAGIDVLHVPYKGEAPALIDLMGGQINFVTPNLAAAMGFVTQGKLRALGVTSRERVRSLPDVPAIAETLPGFENLGWFGFMVPTGTPKAVIDKIHADTVKVLQLPDVRLRFEQLGMFPVGDTPAQFAKYIKEETGRWAKIVAARKLQVD